MPQDVEKELEALVDQHGLLGVSQMLVSICADKAEHVSQNYGDVHLATRWAKCGQALDEAGDRFFWQVS